MKWKKSNEAFPEYSGEYFILNHCSRKDILYFDIEFAQWMDRNEEERWCPRCTQFEWLEMEDR